MESPSQKTVTAAAKWREYISAQGCYYLRAKEDQDNGRVLFERSGSVEEAHGDCTVI